MIIPEERINYYLGNTNYDASKIPSTDDGSFLYDGSEKYKDKNYMEDVSGIFSNSRQDSLWFKCSDSRYTGVNYPIIVKTRDTYDKNSKGIIGPLEYDRHFGPLYHIRGLDTQWENKKNNIIWRGTTTGIGKDTRPCTRIEFVEKYFDKFNVGFPSVANQKWSKIPENLNRVKKCYRDKVPIKEQLEYKYLPVLDGNDKASALNWILISNSVPLMPRPRFHSWMCEHFLEPNVHYVELEDDYSDLEEKFEWCIKNDDVCREIAFNGKCFMYSNFNIKMEKYIINFWIHMIDNIYDKIKGV